MTSVGLDLLGISWLVDYIVIKLVIEQIFDACIRQKAGVW